MARFALFALATVAALVNTSVGYGFKTPCPVDKDICGWALQSNYGEHMPSSFPSKIQVTDRHQATTTSTSQRQHLTPTRT